MKCKSVGWSRISTGSSTVNYVIQGLNPLNQCKSIGSHGNVCRTGKQKYLNSKNHHFNYKMLKVVWKTLPWILQSWENVYLCLICCRNAFITEPKAKHHWILELLWRFTPLHPLKHALSHEVHLLSCPWALICSAGPCRGNTLLLHSYCLVCAGVQQFDCAGKWDTAFLNVTRVLCLRELFASRLATNITISSWPVHCTLALLLRCHKWYFIHSLISILVLYVPRLDSTQQDQLRRMQVILKINNLEKIAITFSYRNSFHLNIFCLKL